MNGFCDLPLNFSDSDQSRVVILPVPYDATGTWIRGADKGPKAILEASAQLELYDIETGKEFYRMGIHTDQPVRVRPSPELMAEEVEERVAGWMGKGKFVACLGGEHSIAIGAIRAHNKKHPGMSVLQLDAHADMRQEYNGSRYNHACVMARAREACPVTQVGIRSMDLEERQYMDPAKVFFMEHLRGNPRWMDEVVGTLPEKVYLSLDLDVLDPACMPSTGTPEPGGMDWYMLLALLRKVTVERELVGFDVVELCPSVHNKAPDFLAAKLVYKLLGYALMNGT